MSSQGRDLVEVTFKMKEKFEGNSRLRTTNLFDAQHRDNLVKSNDNDRDPFEIHAARNAIGRLTEMS